MSTNVSCSQIKPAGDSHIPLTAGDLEKIPVTDRIITVPVIQLLRLFKAEMGSLILPYHGVSQE